MVFDYVEFIGDDFVLIKEKIQAQIYIYINGIFAKNRAF